jgi:general secretion pathway protein J
MGVVFVRTALGPNAAPGLEIVRIVETVDDLGWVLVRQRAPFAPAGLGRPPLASVTFADPVVLLRAPFRVAFAYTGQGEPWKGVWRGATSLPNAIRITVRDAIADRPLSVSTATRVRVDRAAPVPIQSDQESPVR